MLSTYSVVADSGDQTQQDQPDQNGVSSQRENADRMQTQFQYNQSKKQVHIESENNYNGTKSHIEVEIEANDGMNIHFSYSGQFNNTKTVLQIGLEASRLNEFINNNTAIPGYDSNDTLLNSINLRDMIWNLTVSNSTLNNVTTWTINAQASLTNTSTITFQFVFSNGFASLAGNSTLGPNALKWSVIISNYHYSAPNSQLALKMLMKSGDHNDGFKSDKISNQTEDHKDGLAHGNESAVNFGNGTTAGFFSWADSYMVDGQNKTIVTSPAVSVDREDTAQNQLWFSFAQGNVINWDPKVGVDRSTAFSYDMAHPIVLSTAVPVSSSTKASPGFEMLAVILSLGVVALVTKRKFKN